MSLKLLLNGARGRMGVAISTIANDNGAEIVSACDAGDDPSIDITDRKSVV